MPPVDYDKLRERRDWLDLSNPDLAERLDISPNYLVNVLCGTDDPGPRLVRRLSRVLDLPVEEFDLSKRRPPQGDPTEPPEQPANEPKGPPSRPPREPSRPPRPDDASAMRSAS